MIEVNLVESDQKDILVAPAIDEDAQKEAAHDSGPAVHLLGSVMFITTIKNKLFQ